MDKVLRRDHSRPGAAKLKSQMARGRLRVIGSAIAYELRVRQRFDRCDEILNLSAFHRRNVGSVRQRS